MISASLAAVLVVAIYLIKIEHRMPDYEVYRQAAIRARAAEPLYRAEDGRYPYKYFPAFAVALVPLGAIPDRAARAIWFAGSVAQLVGLLYFSLSLLPEHRKTTAMLVGSTFVLLAKFYAHELELGQVNLLMALLIVVAARLLRSGREAEAGLLVAAAVVVKPYAAPLALYLCVRRRMASIATMALSLGVALLAPAIVYGFEGNSRLLTAWWDIVGDQTPWGLEDNNNVSAAAVFHRLVGPGQTADALALVMVAALLATAAYVYARRRAVPFPEGLEVGLLLTMIPILSPHGWDYVFLVSTPAVMDLVNYADTLPRALRTAVIIALLVIAFSLFDLMGRTAYTLFMSWSVITMCYLVVIAGLVTLRARRIA